MKRILALLLCLLLVGCAKPAPQETTAAPQETTGSAPQGSLEVHFIDVGQADCALLLCGGEAMLIDGGNVDDSSLVVSYLLNQGVESLDCLVSTHAHEDHAGALAGVMAVFPVETVYATTTTYASKCYDDFMYYVNQQDLTATRPAPGDTYTLGDALVTFLGPVKDYADPNDTSLVCRVDYGDTSFLFTGDMETTAETDMLDAGANVKADVLKVGHHGSSTSTGYRFLYEVDPTWAVISCETGNSYGHPHRETLEKLADAQVTVYRTDELGTIVATSDGQTITFTTGKTVLPEPTEGQETLYIGNVNSKVFHKEDCSNLPAEKNRVMFGSYDEAVQAGYKPCGNCLE